MILNISDTILLFGHVYSFLGKNMSKLCNSWFSETRGQENRKVFCVSSAATIFKKKRKEKTFNATHMTLLKSLLCFAEKWGHFVSPGYRQVKWAWKVAKRARGLFVARKTFRLKKMASLDLVRKPINLWKQYFYSLFCIFWIKVTLSHSMCRSGWAVPVGPGCRQGSPWERLTFDPLVARVCKLWPQQLGLRSHCEGWRRWIPPKATDAQHEHLRTHTHTHKHLKHYTIRNTHRTALLHFRTGRGQTPALLLFLIITHDFDGIFFFSLRASANIIKYPQSHKVWHGFIN